MGPPAGLVADNNAPAQRVAERRIRHSRIHPAGHTRQGGGSTTAAPPAGGGDRQSVRRDTPCQTCSRKAFVAPICCFTPGLSWVSLVKPSRIPRLIGNDQLFQRWLRPNTFDAAMAMRRAGPDAIP